jgi:NADH-quinone oxidoreductase subunit L
MQNLALIAPLIVLIPAIGAFINFTLGPRLSERFVSIIGTTASGLTFGVAALLLVYLHNNFYQPVIVNPPLINGTWISIGTLEISWQLRVDTLSVTMMFFASLVGTLIHIYSAGYMHGDARYARFFAYLNMFLAFMMLLVSANNFVVMFVGWEGVGLCSYLLIGFWWDRSRGAGWRNSNAARKAMIANRVGDFGVMIAMFLIFWTFGTLDFYKPNEVVNVSAMQRLAEGGDSHGEDDGHTSLLLTSTAAQEDHGEEAADGEHAAEEAHHGPAANLEYTNNDHLALRQMGVFGQTDRLMALGEDETIDFGLGEMRGRTIQVGQYSFDISLMLVLIVLFLLLGVAGKSAQIPLFVWLPDAMAGPTPASSLIHAATMVTAGVYMMVRSNVFLYHSDVASFIVTLVGVGTALVGGFIALGQFDIKRVLAYSTVSQLGFMVAAVGIGAYPAAMFHMITHAFFKALLFMGSGSVIHGMEHGHHHLHGNHGDGHDDHGDDHHDEKAHREPEFDPQDMRNMGGLRHKMPVTYWTYVIGTFALAGIWPFAGFWSKDEILADAWEVGLIRGELKGFIALVLLIAAAAMTAFYMWRQIEMVFHGKARHEAAKHASESNWMMTLPLIILAVSSFFVGFINVPSGVGIFSFGLENMFGGLHSLADFLEFSIAKFHIPAFQPVLAIMTMIIGVTAMFIASRIYGGGRAVNKAGKDPLEADASTAPIWSIAHARMYWDNIYERVFVQPFTRVSEGIAAFDWNILHDYFHDTILYKGFNALGSFLSRPVDIGIIDGAVNGMGRLVRGTAGLLRQAQNGYVRVYAVMLFLGVVVVVVLMLLPMIRG